MNLKEILIKNIINNDEIDNLFNLIRLNKLVDNIIIEKYILTNKSLIINVVEKNKNEILVIYDLYLKYHKNSKDINKLIISASDLDNYINIMLNNNFNRNDEAFILYLLCHIFDNYFDINIISKFLKTDYISKIIGVIRMIEFNLYISDYIKYFDEITFRDSNFHSYYNDKYILEYNPIIGDYFHIKIKLTRNNEFEIYEDINYDDFRIERKLLGNIFNHNGNYYVGEYNESIRISKPVYLKNELNLYNNVFIESLSMYLFDVLKIINGDVKIDNIYKGSIINNYYVFNKIYTHDFYKYNVYEVIRILNNL